MKKADTTSRQAGRLGYTIGRKAFGKISAIEGLRLSASMEADFREFDKQGLSADARRVILARRYGRAR